MSHAEKDKLLILDLDEALLYATSLSLDRSADYMVGEYYVYKRPYVDTFLAQCFEWFSVAVWTSASPEYAAAIVDEAPASVAAEFLPNLLCLYLFELSQKFNVFYENCPILTDDLPLQQSRRALCDLTARTLKLGLSLLGIDVLDHL